MLKIGLGAPQYGVFADPETLTACATAAEDIGYDSLWVGDRALVPAEPRDPYPGGGPVPPEYRVFLDPLATLSCLAHATRRVRLGTSTLNAPFYSPVLLARSLATVDILSGGRLDIGLGLGWSSDEYEAIGVPWRGRGARLEEILDALDRLWSESPVQHEGPLWTIGSSYMDAVPVQRPRPPLLLGGFSPATFERIGRRADGWLGVGLPAPQLSYVVGQIRHSAETHGRDPEALRIVVRVNPQVEKDRAPDDQVPGRGTVRQLADYLLTTHEAGADEVLIDLQQTARSAAELTDLAHQLHEALRTG
ncbi:TIGR03619 family F420-dependent LLM class oxidoreductase [Streptomyces sp. NPDC012389]|uniref:TIGR03619 family F420-dependent LLM class oxidoreductase n=1 Tax=unclassified Streptomyces TaxID=2593676 RepID=UPI00081EC9D4|nr:MULTISPECIES: TIGR03619 family F420-dependent LLM class oxidoreductase [unclassified Streptomyces]MYR96496.1 TIGR03619 family F420-dependent LLM class oxidoreductase [Streptomyces sp. SID4937]SCE10942.1 probable F420-dependent oxidoreductase, Rv2161c family [Streptomyces sp. ScaeMP-e83]